MATKLTGKTLADLRAVHDKSVVIPNRIRAAITKMALDGPENWLYEVDFMKLANVGVIDMRDFREAFKDFWAEMPATNGKSTARRVWFATKKAADAWKAI